MVHAHPGVHSLHGLRFFLNNHGLDSSQLWELLEVFCVVHPGERHVDGKHHLPHGPDEAVQAYVRPGSTKCYTGLYFYDDPDSVCCCFLQVRCFVCDVRRDPVRCVILVLALLRSVWERNCRQLLWVLRQNDLEHLNKTREGEGKESTVNYYVPNQAGSFTSLFVLVVPSVLGSCQFVFSHRFLSPLVQTMKRFLCVNYVPAFTVALQLFSRSASSGSKLTTGSSPHERVHSLLSTDKAALRLHHELTIAMACGDPDAAAECAAAIARRMQRHAAGGSNVKGSDSSAAEPQDLPPPPSNEAMGLLLDRVAGPLGDSASGDGHDESMLNSSAPAPPFWRDPQALTVTILSTDFESENDDDGLDIRILDEYLRKEQESWKEQKRAVANRVLRAAQIVGITPEVVHGSEVEQRKDETFRPLRHVNIVVRAAVAKIPVETEKLISTQVHEIEKKFEERQQLQKDALSPKTLESADDNNEASNSSRVVGSGDDDLMFVSQVAFLELVAASSHMEYSVGLHKDLESALGSDLARQFVSRVVSSLNSAESLEDSKDQEAVRRVAVPYTSMVKLCLWYRTDCA